MKALGMLALPVLVLALAAAGCGSACRTSASDRVDAMLLDRSPSDAANLPVYRRLAHQVARHAARRGSHVLVGTVGALADADWEADRRLTVAARNAFGCRRLRRRAATRLDARIDELFDAPLPTRSSDLIATFIATGRTLATEPRPADVWAISDTYQVGSGVDLYAEPLDPASIDALIARLRAEGLLADLHGARVHFLGVGLAKWPVPTRRQRQVELFWRRWVAVSHGRVVSYDTRMGSRDASV